MPETPIEEIETEFAAIRQIFVEGFAMMHGHLDRINAMTDRIGATLDTIEARLTGAVREIEAEQEAKRKAEAEHMARCLRF